MVQADTREVLGLARQELSYRRPQGRAKQNSYRRTQRARESEVWGRVIDGVGPAPQGVKYLHVCDRGAENIEVFQHCRQQKCGWVVRATQLQRIMETPEGERIKLAERLAAQPVLGSYELSLRGTGKEPPRTARLEVRAARLVMIPLRLEMLRSLRKRPIHTVRDFVRHLAGLGGFLMRKRDGEPGWITLWRGVDKLLLCLRGAKALGQKCG